MIAAVCSWHEHHDRAAEAILSRLDRGERMVVAAPALIEMYAVLTRLPAPYRLSPAAALSLVQDNFLSNVKIAALDARAYQLLLGEAPASGISGGQIYDAVIVACARLQKIQTLLTLNESHFQSFAASDLLIVAP